MSLSNPRSAWLKYRSLWKEETAGPRRLLLKEGEISRKLYVLDEGCVRYWFAHEEKEISFQFCFESDVVYSSESFRKNTPSPFSIETIEPCKLRWLNQEDMDLVRQDPELYPYILENAADKQSAFMRHFFSYLRDTPQQRYANLLRDHPEIIQRIPLQYIASYLGITPVSLSRIRNREIS
jgi:CRP-like cAMP-binding protein